MFTLHLPIPPSANELFGYRRGGRYRTQAYNKWRDEAGWLVKQMKPKPQPVLAEFEILIEVPLGRMDLDNHCKSALDFLTWMQLIDDDRFCREIIIRFIQGMPKEMRLRVSEERPAAGQSPRLGQL